MKKTKKKEKQEAPQYYRCTRADGRPCDSPGCFFCKGHGEYHILTPSVNPKK